MAKKHSVHKIYTNRLETILKISQENAGWLGEQLSEWPSPSSIRDTESKDPLDMALQHATIYNIQSLRSDHEKEAWIRRLDTVINRWRTQRSRERNKKAAVTLDLTWEAREILRRVANEKQTSQSGLVEELIRQAAKRSSRRNTTPADKTASYGPPPPQQFGLPEVIERDEMAKDSSDEPSGPQ